MLAIIHDIIHNSIPKNRGKNRFFSLSYNPVYRNPAAIVPNLAPLIFKLIAKESYFPTNHFETIEDYATIRFSPPKAKTNRPNSIK